LELELFFKLTINCKIHSPMFLKINKKLGIVIVLSMVLGLLGGCNMEYKPHNQVTANKGELSSDLLKSITIGNYARLRNRGYRHALYFMKALQSDNVAWVKKSGDPLSESYGFQQTVTDADALTIWKKAYHAIHSTNTVINSIDDNASEDMLQIKGENLFIRSILYNDLLRIFARPYSQGNPAKNLGVSIVKSTSDSTLKPRATVEKTFGFVASGLKKAADLMTASKPDIFASKEVAWALLARVYLYMEKYNKSIKFANKVINSGRYKLVSTDKLGGYFVMLPKNNPETIFALKRTPDQNPGKASIGSLYNGHDGGWGEIMASNSFLKLIYKNPNDKRIEFLDPDYAKDANGDKIADSDSYSGYKVNKRSGYLKYFNIKYTRQNNIPLLSSPVILRLGEIYLDKAEALAHLGKDKEAISIVNKIRKRAGLKGNQLYTVNDLHGYHSVLDVVLAEKRLELVFEGFRAWDLFRNGKGVDRSYTHGESWSSPGGNEFIPATSKRIVHFIPESEIDLNHKLKQNPLP
jgi:tetratricopeptide (TPR) repeat protein